MQISVTFRNLPSSDAIKSHASEKVSKLKKYFDDKADAHIVLCSEKYNHKAEININAHGLIICAKESSSDMYNSIDRAMEKIENQVRKYHSRLIKVRHKDQTKLKMRYNLIEPTDNQKNQTDKILPATIMETKEFSVRPMMLDEAVMQMDLLDNDILVFLNAKTDHLNVLYRKMGNKYGLFEAI